MISEETGVGGQSDLKYLRDDHPGLLVLCPPPQTNTQQMFKEKQLNENREDEAEFQSLINYWKIIVRKIYKHVIIKAALIDFFFVHLGSEQAENVFTNNWQF